MTSKEPVSISVPGGDVAGSLEPTSGNSCMGQPGKHPELSSHTGNSEPWDQRTEAWGGSTAEFEWGKQRRDRFPERSLVLFWSLVATFNSAAVCVYVGLSALRLLMFFRFCFILFLTCIEQKEFQEMKGIRGKKALASSEMTAKVARGRPFPPVSRASRANASSSSWGPKQHSRFPRTQWGLLKTRTNIALQIGFQWPWVGVGFLFFMVLCY